MNIAVNTRLLIKDKLEGIGWFTYETLKRICKNHPEHHFYFIFDRAYDSSFVFSDNITPIVAGLPTRHPFLWYLWLEHTIPKVLKKINADLFLSPDGFISLKVNIPQIAVIHDINFVHNPHQLPFWVRKYYNYYFPKFADKSVKIATVSEYSKSDICKSFSVNPDKVNVCYNGSNHAYRAISESEKCQVKDSFTQGKDYFIFVGALNPRKNVPGLLKSYELFRNTHNNNHKLVIVGSAMHMTDQIDTVYRDMEFKDDVIFTGRLNIEDLHKLMSSATALVFIPFFEGFGIPLVEAMYAETAIISGNTTSLPEVAGEAALMCSPNDYKQVAEYMYQLANSEQLRQQLISKGRNQRTKFSWDNTAESLWECIESAIKQNVDA